MSLYENLIKQFGYNEPILTEEISYDSYSKAWIYKELNKLCTDGLIVRFDKGVYYIPTQTPLGQSIINPRKVIEKKYIRSKDDIYGYYSGQSLINQLGLSTQMPNVIEVYTNNESTRVRDVSVGRQKVRLRSSRIGISRSNAAVLSFLELMNTISVAEVDDNNRAIITDYIRSNGITRKDISSYSSVFPDKVMRNLIESEVIYSVTQ